MAFSLSILLFQILMMQSVMKAFVTDSTCETQVTSKRTLNLMINSRKDSNGDWLTTFHTFKSDHTITNITLDLMQSVYEDKNGEVVHIKGLIHANRGNSTRDTLTFHRNCGNNAAISNDGRSAEKMKLDDGLNGVILTHRPLRKNELFEVRLDKKHNKFNHCLGIGVTIYSPESLTIPDHMYNLKSGNWMMYHTNVYVNGVQTFQNYGRNLNELKVGDRVGVMVNNHGVLNFFVNGVDQGPAASNLPLTLYGVFELYYNAAKGTIIDSSS